MDVYLKFKNGKKITEDFEKIQERIFLVLRDESYKVLSRQDNTTFFKYDEGSGIFISRPRIFAVITKGKFELNKIDHQLMLYYSISVIAELIAIPLVTVLAIIYDQMLFIGSGVFLFQFFVRLILVRANAMKLLNSIAFD